MKKKSETKLSSRLRDDVVFWSLARIGVFLVVFFIQIYAIRILLGKLNSNPFELLGDYQDLAGAAANLVCASLAILVASYGSSVNFKTIGFKASRSEAIKQLLLGFLIGAAVISSVIALLALAGGYTFCSFRPDVNLLPYFVLFFIAALAEELVFRGFVFQLFEKSVGTIKALIVASVFFGYAHLVNGVSQDQTAMMIACGFLVVEAGIPLNLAFVLSRNLWLALGVHWGWNFFEGAIFGAGVSGLDLSHSLIKAEVKDGILGGGGSFGPEATLLGLFVGLVFSTLMWKRVQKSGAI